MKNKDKKILELVQSIQALAMKIKNINVYYQSNISLLSIYSLGENGKYTYNRDLYLDCETIIKKENVIKELKIIIKDMEDMKHEQNNFNGSLNT
jgi:hypothetical protein